MILESGKIFSFILLLIVWLTSAYLYKQSKEGKVRQIRRIPGLDAIDETIMRSVELGRPVVVSPGKDAISGSRALPMLSGVAMVRYIASETAKVGIPLHIPAGAPDLYTISAENYRSGCIEGGHPEAYNPMNVYFFTDQVWSYISSTMNVIGTVKPGAVILVGRLGVETIYFGTLTHRIGAMLIGGTNVFSQASFFSCVADYTLLGDELFAAAAYVSKNPELMGDLTTQDVAKWIGAILIIIGSILLTAGSDILVKLVSM